MKCLILDTSIGSDNKGDIIINECFRDELRPILEKCYTYTLPTHVSSFHWYQVWRNSLAIRRYASCDIKLVAGTNLLVPNMLTHYPQWNINIFNCKPFKDVILVGVGAGAGEKTNWYTRKLYNKILNHNFAHSVRDERSKEFVEKLGLNAINTGCVTMWCLTPEFCKAIPTQKANSVIFTLTASSIIDKKDQYLIDTLNKLYEDVYFWIQGDQDYHYLNQFKNIERIHIVPPTVEDFSKILQQPDIDYVGTRLHAGVYAMRHSKRSVVLAIDERAREINKKNNLNCIEKEAIEDLPLMLQTPITTDIRMPYDEIAKWRSQFDNIVLL